jgi:hypothetical protein
MFVCNITSKMVSREAILLYNCEIHHTYPCTPIHIFRINDINWHTPASPAAPICVFGSLGTSGTSSSCAARSESFALSGANLLYTTSVQLHTSLNQHSYHTSDLGRVTCGEYKFSSEYKSTRSHVNYYKSMSYYYYYFYYYSYFTTCTSM